MKRKDFHLCEPALPHLQATLRPHHPPSQRLTSYSAVGWLCRNRSCIRHEGWLSRGWVVVGVVVGWLKKWLWGHPPRARRISCATPTDVHRRWPCASPRAHEANAANTAAAKAAARRCVLLFMRESYQLSQSRAIPRTVYRRRRALPTARRTTVQRPLLTNDRSIPVRLARSFMPESP